VNAWLVHHIYMPLLNRGYSQNTASFFVFFVSGFFHELVLSVPFRSVKLLAFSAMMLQLPLSYLTRKYTKGKILGNILFWASFMFGQSNCILLYWYDFVYSKQVAVIQ
jgi:diacylglycerol O-acyltransferase-1